MKTVARLLLVVSGVGVAFVCRGMDPAPETRDERMVRLRAFVAASEERLQRAYSEPLWGQ